MIYIPWIEKKIKERSKQQLCNRCGLFFLKENSECPHCQDLSDGDLKTQLEKRSAERLNIGKAMLWSSISVAIILFVVVVVLGK